MTIEKLPSGSWRITEMKNGIRYRATVNHKPTKTEAQNIITEKVNSGVVSASKNDSFEAAAKKYIELKNNVLSPWTLDGYARIVKYISPAFRAAKIANIDATMVQKEINDYSATHSPKSTRNLHSLISSVLKEYRPQLILNTRLPQKSKFEASTPSEDHIQKILDEVAGSMYEIPFRLACYGLRRGEICALTAADLDGNMLTINKALAKDGKEYVVKPCPKTTESNRTIYIDDDLAAKIIATEGPVFPYRPNNLNDHLQDTLKRLKLPHFRFHDFRAYYVSMAHSLGIPDAYIMANGGWSSTYTMNKVYKRTLEKQSAEANKIISEHLAPKKSF